ncbi:MAG: hypothetical protein WC073_09975 [Sterolibacterium sp.]
MLDQNTIEALKQLGISAESAEAAMSGMLFLTLLSVATAIPTGILAKRKGRSVAFWVIFALTIPVIPLLLVWLLPKLYSDPEK